MPAPQIVFSDVAYHKEGGRYTDLTSTACDLLYIDAPYVAKKSGKPFGTHTGKPAYYDFETLFDRSIFPKVIMVEGRTDTADAILASPHAGKYSFSSGFLHASQRQQ